MRTPEEVLSGFGIKENTPFHNYAFLYRTIIKAMHEYATPPAEKQPEPNEMSDRAKFTKFLKWFQDSNYYLDGNGELRESLSYEEGSMESDYGKVMSAYEKWLSGK